MKKIIITLLLVFALPSFAQAFDITLPVGPGGASGRTANIISEILKDNNINAEIKFNANCAVVKNQIETSNTSMVYMNTSQGLFDQSCKIDINGKNIKIIDELYYYTLGICYRSDRVELGLEHFLNTAVKKNIATTIVTNDIVKQIVTKMHIDGQTNLVPVGSSGKTREVILGSEFDYAVVDADWVIKNTDKVSCLFLGSESDTEVNGKKFPSLKILMNDKFKEQNVPLLQDVFVLIGVNLDTKQEAQIHNEIELVRKNSKWKEFVSKFGNGEVTISDNKFNKISLTLGGK